jgi:hypothetical protein
MLPTAASAVFSRSDLCSCLPAPRLTHSDEARALLRPRRRCREARPAPRSIATVTGSRLWHVMAWAVAERRLSLQRLARHRSLP